jgi:hypothetical protein
MSSAAVNAPSIASLVVRSCQESGLPPLALNRAITSVRSVSNGPTALATAANVMHGTSVFWLSRFGFARPGAGS